MPTFSNLASPKLAIQHSLALIGVVELKLAVEATGSAFESRVELVEVVCGANHEDAVVGLETVDFVEEVGAHGGCDEGIEVFEDEEAGRGLAGFGEDEGSCVLWSSEATEVVRSVLVVFAKVGNGVVGKWVCAGACWYWIGMELDIPGKGTDI